MILEGPGKKCCDAETLAFCLRRVAPIAGFSRDAVEFTVELGLGQKPCVQHRFGHRCAVVQVGGDHPQSARCFAL